MDIITNKEDFLRVLQIVSKTIPANATLDVLYSVMIEADKESVSISANNLELGIKYKFKDIEIKEAGKAVVNAKMLINIISSIKEEQISLKASDTTLNIGFGMSLLKLPCINSDQFPVVKNVEDEKNYFEIEKQIFSSTILGLQFMNVNVSDPKYSSIFLKFKDNKFSAFALESGRISYRESEIKQSGEMDLIIPTNSLISIAKILMSGSKLLDSDKAKIYQNNNMILIVDDNLVITAIRSATTMFDIEKYINRKLENLIFISKEPFYSVLKRSLIIGQSSVIKKPVKLKISSNEEIKIECNSEFGSLDEKIEFKGHCEDTILTFNQKYLTDVFEHIDDDQEVAMEFDSKQRTLLRIKNVKNNKYNYLIAPLSN